jgi:hypothetical protein
MRRGILTFLSGMQTKNLTENLQFADSGNVPLESFQFNFSFREIFVNLNSPRLVETEGLPH